MAWSPCGDFLLTGDTAKTARIWNVTDGSSKLNFVPSCQFIDLLPPPVSIPGLCIKQITEHTNFVQGVAWDPLGKFIATQSSYR